MRVYIAGPLFSEAERAWIEGLKQRLQSTPGLEPVWSADELRAPRLVSEIFSACKEGLDTSDAMLAILDGSQVDDGTAWEIGYFYALQKGPIIGLRTDFRRAGELPDSTVNAMIEGACEAIASDVDDALAELTRALDERARA